jgi:hypothetical protein
MHLTVRNTLPWLVGAFWLLLWLLLPAGFPSDRWSDFEIITWFAAMFALMIGVDRAWVEYTRRRIGVDPMKMHWSQLRNRKGAFFCAACQSVFMLPPEDFDEAKPVRWGDCGHAVAPYGEMKPYLLGFQGADGK